MTRIMSMSSRGVSVDERGGDFRMGAKSRGFGMPPVANQWFEGAGDGASFRGARVLPRVLDLELKLYARSRAEIEAMISKIARLFDPRRGPVRLVAEIDGADWFVDVRREGGGDWEQGVDTDGQTFLKTIVTVKAGDPYWTRVDQESRQIVLGGLGRGLIKSTSLSKLQVSSTAAFGEVTFENTGDVDAFAIWKLEAPFSGFTLTSPDGEVLEYENAKATGFIEVNMELGTIVDELGVDKYDGLAPTPRFWAIPEGSSTATVALPDATSVTRVTVIWAPRKWVLF